MIMSTSPPTFIPKIDLMVVKPSWLVGGEGYRRYVDLRGQSPSEGMVDGREAGSRKYISYRFRTALVDFQL